MIGKSRFLGILLLGFAAVSRTPCGLEGEPAFSGIGVRIASHPDGIRIDRVMPGGGAERAGLKAGEIIIAIDGIMTRGIKTEQAAKLIRGEEGTMVELAVRDESGGVQSLDVERSRISALPVVSRVLEGRIGVLEITGFEEYTSLHVRRELDRLSDKGIEGLILDLRGRSSGSLNEIRAVADLFLPAGQTLWLVQAHGQTPERARSIIPTQYHLPMVVLIDRNTEGGELIAAALKGNRRAVLVGHGSSGRTVSRRLVERNDGTTELVPYADFLMDDETPITGRGVEPDVMLSPEATPEAFLEKGVEALKARMRVTKDASAKPLAL